MLDAFPTFDALHNKTSFKLADRTDDYHHGTTQRPTCVDVLPETDERYIQVVEFIQNFEEMLDRPSHRSNAQTIARSNLRRRGIGHDDDGGFCVSA